MMNIENFHHLGLSYDQWMDISALTGMTLFMLSVWVTVSGRVRRGSLPMLLFRAMTCALMLLPIATRWYFSENILFMCGVGLAIISGWFIYRDSRKY